MSCSRSNVRAGFSLRRASPSDRVSASSRMSVSRSPTAPVATECNRFPGPSPPGDPSLRSTRRSSPVGRQPDNVRRPAALRGRQRHLQIGVDVRHDVRDGIGHHLLGQCAVGRLVPMCGREDQLEFSAASRFAAAIVRFVSAEGIARVGGAAPLGVPPVPPAVERGLESLCGAPPVAVVPRRGSLPPPPGRPTVAARHAT